MAQLMRDDVDWEGEEGETVVGVGPLLFNVSSHTFSTPSPRDPMLFREILKFLRDGALPSDDQTLAHVSLIVLNY